MEISGVMVLAVGLAICAAAGLFSARAASRPEGVDRAEVELPKTMDRNGREHQEEKLQLSMKEVTHDL